MLDFKKIKLWWAKRIYCSHDYKSKTIYTGKYLNNGGLHFVINTDKSLNENVRTNSGNGTRMFEVEKTETCTLCGHKTDPYLYYVSVKGPRGTVYKSKSKLKGKSNV